MVEREPITVVVSEKGWIRAMKGPHADLAALAFKTGDRLKAFFQAETTDKMLVFATGGRFYTLAADKLPGGRGHGEPIRLMVDMDGGRRHRRGLRPRSGRKLLVASTDGNGFVVPEDEVLANTRKGKQVLNVKAPDKAAPGAGRGRSRSPSIGENRKMLVFPLDQVPEMTRGKGVRLQRYKDGGSGNAAIDPAAAIFDQLCVDVAVFHHHRIVEDRHVDHSAGRMARVEIGAKQGILFRSRRRGAFRPDEVAVQSDHAAERSGEAELVYDHAHGNTGAAGIAGRAISDRLRAAKAALGQEVVHGGRALADEMGEDLAFQLARQIGAGRRAREKKLRRVARLLGHGSALNLL
jgi:DNA gyrase/topoisomerase IV subunit A